jgi:Saxitoxin biosynthesis operon protein SxtJ
VPRLDRAGLRKFGLTTGLGLIVLFGVLLPWLLQRLSPRWPWVAGGVLVAAALLAPNALRIIYTPWMRLALLINRLTTPLIGGAVFFLVMTPVAWIMRAVGNDPMSRRIDREAPSYRVKSSNPPSSNMERPF